MRRLPILAALILTFFACKKDETGIKDTPEIQLLEAGPGEVKQNQDSVWFRISYTDGNGDLGSEDPNSYNLFVQDSRIADLQYKYRISDLVPGSGSVPIKGNLSFSISNTLLVNGSNPEQVTYSIYVVDQAGNTSNTVRTQAITVKP